ncbi:MAG: phospholipase C, phosphocholine-specific [Deltaproteobacteria bacterium]|nr:phospholipase C, phosphocholine-specific [Deltaproteobacteria bacterium]
MPTRRTLLGHAAKGAAVTAAWPATKILGASRSSLSAVKHVVIFSQENRSFDHYCGTMGGVRGYGDRHPVRQPNGDVVFAQRTRGGKVVYPYRLASGITSGQCVGEVAHDWSTGTDALNDGHMDGWGRHKGHKAMSYYTRADIPYFYGLADAFTLCDAYFCSFNGPTNPNRLFMMTGTIDAGGRHEGPITDNHEPGFSWTTYPERLQTAGVSWRIYQEEDNYDNNALAWFKQFRDAPRSSPLYQNGMHRWPRSQFASDVRNNTLPAVSWILAPTEFSEHPEHSPNRGMHFAAQNYIAALAANPDVWATTVFIWTYDENGGFFDHVVPPMPAPGTQDEMIDGRPLGLGPRVPTLIMSPWSRGGAVCSEVFDHTSLLRFLEVWTGVQEPNISAWRRTVCGDLTSAFDFTSMTVAFPGLPDPQPAADLAVQNCESLRRAAPADENAVPPQEERLKPLRVSPYRFEAELTVQAHAQRLKLTVANAGAVGASFHVRQPESAPLHFTASAGQVQRVNLGIKNNVYDVELHGPVGFFRGWQGRLLEGEPQLEVTVDAAQRKLAVIVANPCEQQLALELSSPLAGLVDQCRSMVVPGRSSFALSLPCASGWYDYVFTCEDVLHWKRQLAGHVGARATISGGPSQSAA